MHIRLICMVTNGNKLSYRVSVTLIGGTVKWKLVDPIIRRDVNDCPLASSLWRPHLAVVWHPHAKKWIDHNFVGADEVVEFLC